MDLVGSACVRVVLRSASGSAAHRDPRGARTEVHGLSSAGVSRTVVIIPGNPGIAGFYTAFAHQLFARLNGLVDEQGGEDAAIGSLSDAFDDDVLDLECLVHSFGESRPDARPFEWRWNVIAVSHAGHSSGGLGGTFTLDDQVEHKLAFIDNCLCRGPLRHEVVVVGHSIGAWIGMKVLRRNRQAAALQKAEEGAVGPDRRSAHVARAVNLFPTFRHVHRGMTPFVRIAILPGVRQFLSGVLHYGPTWLRTLVLSFSESLTDEAKYITHANAEYDVAMNVLTMAYIEARDVTEIDPDIHECLTEHVGHMHFLYGRHDAYAPLAFCEELKCEHPRVNTEYAGEHIAHAFCLQSGPEVADIVHGYLCDSSKEHTSS